MFNRGKVRQVLCLNRRKGGQIYSLSIATAKKAATCVTVTNYSTSGFFKKPVFPDRHELRKKSDELPNLNTLYWYLHPQERAELIATSYGNPRLMEWIDTLVGEKKSDGIPQLLAAVRGKQEEFVREYVLKELLATQPAEFHAAFSRASVFRIPVQEKGMLAVCNLPLANLQLATGVSLGLVEHDQRASTFWITPLLREKLFGELSPDDQLNYHTAACKYYHEIVNPEALSYFVEAEELIYHAIVSSAITMVCKEGANLVGRLRDSLAYAESKRIGEWILASLLEVPETEDGGRLLNEMGYTFRQMGDNRLAITYYEQALTLYKKLFGEKHQHVATHLNNLGAVWAELGENKKAIDYFEQALTINRKVFGEEHPDVAILLNNLGVAWDDLGEKRKAISYYEWALAIDHKVLGEEHPKIARDFNNLGAVWSELGEKRKAIDYYERALTIDRKVFGEEHPKVVILFNNLGMVWSDLGEKEKAIGYYEQALAISRNVFGEEHPKVAILLNNLGLAWDDLGEKKKAIGYYEQVLTILRKVFGDEHSNVAGTFNNLGVAWSDLGEKKKAISYYEQALTIDRRVFGEEHPSVALCLNNLGMALAAVGESNRGRACLQRAYEIWRKFYGEDHPDTQMARRILGSKNNQLLTVEAAQ